jgi:hypothetical protein
MACLPSTETEQTKCGTAVAFMTEALSMSLKDHLKEEDSKQTRTQRAIHA